MARAATTADVFNAVAEPRRREIIDRLAEHSPLSVGALVAAVGLAQPAVSKHLNVLRRVGLVSMDKRGRHRLYRLNPRELKTVHDWTSSFERFWTQQLDRIRTRAERRARPRASESPQGNPEN